MVLITYVFSPIFNNIQMNIDGEFSRENDAFKRKIAVFVYFRYQKYESRLETSRKTRYTKSNWILKKEGFAYAKS